MSAELLSLVVEPAEAGATTIDVALLGAVGVVVGACIAAAAQLFGAWIGARQARLSRRRDVLVAHVAEFWTACDALWRATDSLSFIVDEMVNDRSGRTQEHAVKLEVDRQESFRKIATAEGTSGKVLALLNIEFPDLAQPATKLRAAAMSKRGGALEASSRQKIYEDARVKFEESAKREMKRTR